MHRRNFLMALRDELRLADLALSKARRDATLANMSQGIVMREPNGLIPVINRRAIELLGLPERFLQGTLLRQRYPAPSARERGIQGPVAAGRRDRDACGSGDETRRSADL